MMYSQKVNYRKRGNNKECNSEERFYKSIKEHFGENYKEEILSLEQLDIKRYNELIDSLKKYLCEQISPPKGRPYKRFTKITSSQLRNIFLIIKKSKMDNLMLVRPKLAYVAGRADNDETKELVFLFEELIKAVNDEEKLKNLKLFFEAVIAYHKYFGGR